MLWETQIGEEYVNCTNTSLFFDRTSGVQKVYEFNQTVTPQCGTVDNNKIMLFTTDFCCKSYPHAVAELDRGFGMVLTLFNP